MKNWPTELNCIRVAAILILSIFASAASAQTPAETYKSNWIYQAQDDDIKQKIDLTFEAIEAGDTAGLAKSLTEEIFNLNLTLPPLNYAVSKGNPDIVTAILEAGAKIDSIEFTLGTGTTPLMTAAAMGDLDMVELLIARGADLSVVGLNGQTFTALAIRSGLLPANAVLPMSERGDPNEKISQETLDALLRQACADADRYQIHTLLTLGASMKARDPQGRTALMYLVAGSRNAASSEEAVQAMEDIHRIWDRIYANEVDEDGNTPLGVAILTSAHPEVITYILERTDDRDHKNAAGLSYHDLAERAGGNALALLPEKPWEPEQIVLPSFPIIEVPLKPVMTKSDWRMAQQALKRLGLYSSSIDGAAGPATKRGLAAYFKVLLDDFYTEMLKTCDKAWPNLEEVATRFPGEEIKFHQTNIYSSRGNYTFTIRSQGMVLYCIGTAEKSREEKRKSWAYIQLYVNRFLSIYVVPTLDCANREWQSRSSIIEYPSGKDLAMDWGCERQIGGVPRGNGTLTLWGRY